MFAPRAPLAHLQNASVLLLAGSFFLQMSTKGQQLVGPASNQAEAFLNFVDAPISSQVIPGHPHQKNIIKL